jgi:hypothetical protein
MKTLLPLMAAAVLFAEVKPVPPPGINVPAADHAELQAELSKLGESIRKN